MSRPVRVLHVDDEPSFGELVVEFLQREDDRFEVTTVTSAGEGLTHLAADGQEIDCVVSDFDMPDKNGIAFLQTVRDTHPDLPFILFTGKGSEEVASEAISAGVTDYLQKERGTDQYTVLANRIWNAVERTRAEQDRAEMRERMELALRETDSVTFEIDIETGNVSRHGAVEEVFDIPAERIATQEAFVETVVHPEDRDCVRDFFKQLQESDQASDTFDYRTSPEIGDIRWMRASAYYDNSTDHERIIGLARDISEQKEREQDLETERNRFKSLFESLPVATVISRDPEDGSEPIVQDANSAFVETFGFEKTEIVGESLNEYIVPDDRLEAARDIDQQDFLNEVGKFEVKRQTAADELRDFRLINTGVDIPGGPDQVEGIVIYTDITERKARVQEIEETNALLSTLIETLPVGILAEDTSRHVLLVNERLLELFDFPGSPEDVIGADCEQLAEAVSDMFVASTQFVERINELVTERESTRNEELALHDGRIFARSHEPIELPDGSGHLWIYRDITDRKEHERR